MRLQQISLWALVLLCLFSCVSKKNAPTLPLTPAIDMRQPTQVFDAEINMRGNAFSGVLVIKQGDNGSVRIAFASTFGLTLFDFDIYPDSLVTHYCVEPLQNKHAIIILEQDLRALIAQPNSELLTYKKSKNGSHTLQIGKGMYKAKMVLNNYQNGYPKKIIINHNLLNINWIISSQQF